MSKRGRTRSDSTAEKLEEERLRFCSLEEKKHLGQNHSAGDAHEVVGAGAGQASPVDEGSNAAHAVNEEAQEHKRAAIKAEIFKELKEEIKATLMAEIKGTLIEEIKAALRAEIISDLTAKAEDPAPKSSTSERLHVPGLTIKQRKNFIARKKKDLADEAGRWLDRYPTVTPSGWKILFEGWVSQHIAASHQCEALSKKLWKVWQMRKHNQVGRRRRTMELQFSSYLEECWKKGERQEKHWGKESSHFIEKAILGPSIISIQLTKMYSIDFPSAKYKPPDEFWTHWTSVLTEHWESLHERNVLTKYVSANKRIPRNYRTNNICRYKKRASEGEHEKKVNEPPNVGEEPRKLRRSLRLKNAIEKANSDRLKNVQADNRQLTNGKTSEEEESEEEEEESEEEEEEDEEGELFVLNGDHADDDDEDEDYTMINDTTKKPTTVSTTARSQTQELTSPVSSGSSCASFPVLVSSAASLLTVGEKRLTPPYRSTIETLKAEMKEEQEADIQSYDIAQRLNNVARDHDTKLLNVVGEIENVIVAKGEQQKTDKVGLDVIKQEDEYEEHDEQKRQLAEQVLDPAHTEQQGQQALPYAKAQQQQQPQQTAKTHPNPDLSSPSLTPLHCNPALKRKFGEAFGIYDEGQIEPCTIPFQPGRSNDANNKAPRAEVVEDVDVHARSSSTAQNRVDNDRSPTTQNEGEPLPVADAFRAEIGKETNASSGDLRRTTPSQTASHEADHYERLKEQLCHLLLRHYF